MQNPLHVEIALVLMVMFPLAGAMLNGIAGRKESKRFVSAVAIGSVALSFVSAVVAFGALLYGRFHGDPETRIVADVYEWLRIFLQEDLSVDIRIRFVMDALSGVMALVITGIGLLIHIYSAGYMSEESSYARFFSYLNLFMASMLILILGSSLPVMFVGWEGVGLCSYLLIGFWWENPAYAAAGRKAFIANRIGDFGVIAAMLFLLASAHSLEFTDINHSASSLASTLLPLPWASSLGIDSISFATVACLCLFLGCAGKSAQIPLYVWLPDAMAGPTPVSALIHAATMVTAGVYLTCRLSPLFSSSPVAMAAIAVVGTLTALLGASIALVQNHLKKVLAYSTVSQLGFMFAGVGVGAFTAGFFHVFTHAFFKACLFLGAGSVMHAVHAHGDADIRHLGGLRRYMPITHLTFLISCLAIAGIPPFSGFFSKDEILLGAAESAPLFPFAPWLSNVIFFSLLFAAVLTAFYMFRLYFLTFTGEYRGAHPSPGTHAANEHIENGPAELFQDHAEVQEGLIDSNAIHSHHDTHHSGTPHESPKSMAIPLVVLALGAAVVGFLGMPHTLQELLHIGNLWNPWLEPAVKNIEMHGEGPTFLGLTEHAVPWAAMAFGTAAGIGGVFLSWFVYGVMRGRPAMRLAVSFPGMHQRMLEKWRIDELYDTLFLKPLRKVAELSAAVDKVVVDGVLTRLSAAIVRVFGYATSRAQTGQMANYATWMTLGVAALGWWLAYPHARFKYEAVGERVTFQVYPGLGYAQRWDFNSDGVFDTKWSSIATHNTRDTSYIYKPYDARAVIVRIERAGFRPESLGEFRMHLGEARAVPEKFLSSSDSHMSRPIVHFTRKGLRFEPNGGSWSKGGNTISQKEIAWSFGETLELGMLRLQVVPEVCATLEIKGPLGFTSHARKHIILPSKSKEPRFDELGNEITEAARPIQKFRAPAVLKEAQL